MSSPMRKQRKQNFTNEELEFLLDMVKLHKLDLFSAMSLHRKKEVWAAIAQKLADQGWPARTGEDVKKKWQNVQTETKNMYTYAHKTGRPHSKWNHTNDCVLSIISSPSTNLLLPSIHPSYYDNQGGGVINTLPAHETPISLAAAQEGRGIEGRTTANQSTGLKRRLNDDKMTALSPYVLPSEIAKRICELDSNLQARWTTQQYFAAHNSENGGNFENGAHIPVTSPTIPMMSARFPVDDVNHTSLLSLKRKYDEMKHEYKSSHVSDSKAVDLDRYIGNDFDNSDLNVPQDLSIHKEQRLKDESRKLQNSFVEIKPGKPFQDDFVSEDTNNNVGGTFVKDQWLRIIPGGAGDEIESQAKMSRALKNGEDNSRIAYNPNAPILSCKPSLALPSKTNNLDKVTTDAIVDETPVSSTTLYTRKVRSLSLHFDQKETSGNPPIATYTHGTRLDAKSAPPVLYAIDATTSPKSSSLSLSNELSNGESLHDWKSVSDHQIRQRKRAIVELQYTYHKNRMLDVSKIATSHKSARNGIDDDNKMVASQLPVDPPDVTISETTNQNSSLSACVQAEEKPRRKTSPSTFSTCDETKTSPLKCNEYFEKKDDKEYIHDTTTMKIRNIQMKMRIQEFKMRYYESKLRKLMGNKECAREAEDGIECCL